MKKRISSVLATLALAIVSTVGALAISPTSASAYDDTCAFSHGGPALYFYHSYEWGAKNCQNGWVPDLGSPAVKFFACGKDCAGLGQNVVNNAGSGENLDYDCKLHIWYHANYTGSVLTLNNFNTAGWYSDTLGVVNNNNRSQSWC